MNRNGRPDDFVHHDADEVDVRHLAADRIDLDLLDHGVTLRLAARHLEQENRADSVLALLDQVGDRFAIDHDGHGVSVTAVNDRRDLPLLPKSSRWTLARFLPPQHAEGHLSDHTAPPTASPHPAAPA